jgi:hypothetical protein
MTESKGPLPVAGGLLTSKPAWLDTERCSATPAFLLALVRDVFDPEGPSR